MRRTSKILTICGGGHLGHVCAGFLGAQEGVEVRLLTRRPQLWADCVEVTDPDGVVFKGKLAMVTDNPAEALRGADIALLCLPGFSIEEELRKIESHLDPTTAVGTVVSSTGFFFHAFKVLCPKQPLFGFQRVPFISRMKEYGSSADLLGYKPSLSMAIEQCEDKEALRQTIEWLFKVPVELLGSHYEVSLSNSNPLLHTSRLYTLWKDYQPGMVYEHNPQFYSDWTEDTSALYIAMDKELQSLLKVLGVKEGAIPDVLTYYESTDSVSLTAKLHSIKAFQGLMSPMNEVEGGFVPDFTSRYFTEDFAYGLKFAYDLCREKEVPCPNIETVYEWGRSVI